MAYNVINPSSRFVLGQNLKINTVNYSYPSVQGTLGTALINDGSGNLTWSTPAASVDIGSSIPSGTVGSLLFVGTGQVLAEDNPNLFWDNTNKRLGIGTVTPTDGLSVIGGISSYGSTLLTTSLRVGSSSDATGLFATAIGTNQTASANYALAIGGAGSTASGVISIAIGGGTASAGGTIAIGNGSVASDAGAVALGAACNATMIGSIAIGAANATTSNFTIAMGNNAGASGLKSIAIGYVASASLDGSIAMGTENAIVTVADQFVTSCTLFGLGGGNVGNPGLKANGTQLDIKRANDSAYTDLGLAKIATYNSIATAAWGVPAIYASGRSTAQTGAVASVATYTVGAADGSFEISSNVNVTTSTLHSFAIAVDYTDETGTARTLTIPVEQLAGTLVTAITNGTGAGPYSGVLARIRCQIATSITVKTMGTFTSVVYNVEADIRQVS